MAKKSGILVEEFGFGIPPRIFGKKIGETIYSINLFPFGGFVKVLGEDAEGVDFNNLPVGSFAGKSAINRILVLVAGVFTNIVLGSVLFFIVLSGRNFVSTPLMLLGDNSYNFPFGQKREISTTVTYVVPGSPAEKAGIGFGDFVQDFPSVSSLQEYIGKNSQKEIILNLGNLQSPVFRSVVVTPEFNKELDRGVIGVGLGSAVYLEYKGIEKPFSGFLHGINTTAYSLKIMSNLVGESAKSKSLKPVSTGFSGPVGIFGLVEQVVTTGGDSVLITLIEIVALLSFSLALFNILPFPALDGGRVAFILIEIVIRKRISPKVQSATHSVGLAVLLLLMLAVTLNDIFGKF
jgi:regulator of sigma E protease